MEHVALNKKEKILFIVLILCFVITVAGGLFIIGKLPEENTPSQQLLVHSTALDCTVIEVKQGLFNLNISIYNADLNIEKTFVLTGKDAKKFQEVREGDMVTGYLYYWTNGDEIIDWVVLLYQIF